MDALQKVRVLHALVIATMTVTVNPLCSALRGMLGIAIKCLDVMLVVWAIFLAEITVMIPSSHQKRRRQHHQGKKHQHMIQQIRQQSKCLDQVEVLIQVLSGVSVQVHSYINSYIFHIIIQCGLVDFKI
jgi:uncharacterized membrane protein